MHETLKEFKAIIPKLLSDTNTLTQISKQSGIAVGVIHMICKASKNDLKDFKITAKEKALMQDFCKANAVSAYSNIIDDQDDLNDVPRFESEIESYGMKKARNREEEDRETLNPVVFKGVENRAVKTEVEKLFIAVRRLERSTEKHQLLVTQ
jgi:hypothetical protein